MSFISGREAALDEVRASLVREAASKGPSLVAWVRGALGRGDSRNATETISEEEARVQAIARRACALLLVPDSGTAPLVPRGALRLPTGVETIQSEFSEEDLGLLEALADERAPAALRARVHDLRWVILRDGPSGDVALASYLEIALAANLGRAEEAHAAGDALLRAANLGLERRDTPRVESVFRELLPRALEQSPASTLHRFFQAAEHLRGVGRIFLANLAITRAESEMNRQQHSWARTFFAHGRRSLIAVYRSEDAKTLAAMRAHVLAEEARLHFEAGQPAWVAASYLEYALEELRLLQGTREQLASLERERDELLALATLPDGAERDGGRMAMALDEVLRAYDSVDPLLRWRFVGLLPIDPPAGPQILGHGAQVLDLFLRRFGESGSGRVLQLAANETAGTHTHTHTVSDEAVQRWTSAATQWLVPILVAVRATEPSDPALHMEALEHVLETSSASVSARAAHLRRGLEAAWDGDHELAIEHLVPEALHLREEPSARAAIESNPGLLLVDTALFDHPKGLGLAQPVLAAESSATPEAQSELLLWWTLRLIGMAAECSPAPAALRQLP